VNTGQTDPERKVGATGARRGNLRITRPGGSTWAECADVRGVTESVRAALAPAVLRSPAELDAALDAGLLTVAYQPVVSLRTGAVVAAECLVRLRQADGGLLPPDCFIPLAEATGRVGRIDRMVLAQAAPLATQWRALLGPRPFSIGVNVSAASLSDPSLVDFVNATCIAAALPLDALVIEVTETVLSAAGSGHDEVLRAIDGLGCNVTMDDFGTGYSSLSHLTRFPVDGIKIDRRFVWDIGRPGRGGRVPAALVRLGLDLGMHVVAEGVETEEQLAALQTAGCPFAQGYLFSRPLPAADLTAYLHASAATVPLPRIGDQP
jgi:EAL domain-containing protein (putative c-di-GMP-specific phosphodiesterase class I)